MLDVGCSTPDFSFSACPSFSLLTLDFRLRTSKWPASPFCLSMKRFQILSRAKFTWLWGQSYEHNQLTGRRGFNVRPA
jgi:hypothetical protein